MVKSTVENIAETIFNYGIKGTIMVKGHVINDSKVY